MKKVFVMMLTVLLCVGVICAASAETDQGTTGQCEWTFDGTTGRLTISGTGNMGSDQSWSTYKNDITSVVIENGVTSIVLNAFRECTGLTSVSIADSVITIGNNSFSGCSNLTTVIVEGSIDSIGRYAFKDCTSLTSFMYRGTEVPEMDHTVFNGCGPFTIFVPKDYKGERFADMVVNRLPDTGGEEKPATYTVTVSNDGNGTASATPAFGNMGTEVTLTATPKEGYAFKEWQVVSGDVTIADNKFTLSTENVEVKAIFKRIPVLPKFDAPLKDTVVEVMEGQAVQMSVVCANADSYQWFVDYGDGRGWQMIGDGKATYTGAPVKLENDGYRYYCCATNGDGSTNSAVFTLKVMALPKTDDLPKTGDISRLALWLCLLGIAGAAAWLRRRAYR